MNTIPFNIVQDDQQITLAMQSENAYRLQQLVGMYQASADKDAFVHTLCARLLLEHDRRQLLRCEGERMRDA